jgi:hypothetical protein
MCKRPNLDVKVLAALESSGVERVKLELMRMTGTNLFTFCDVNVSRGVALDWLSGNYVLDVERAMVYGPLNRG